jgi:hypothetical protein
MDSVKLIETDLKDYKRMIIFSHCSVNFEKGRIINANTKEILGKVDKESGYEVLTIGDRLKLLKHRLIWDEAHPGEVIKENEMIIHIDGDKTNNKLSNLKKVIKDVNMKEEKENFVPEKDFNQLCEKYNKFKDDIIDFIDNLIIAKDKLAEKYDFINEI